MNRQQVMLEAINRIDSKRVVTEKTTSQIWGSKYGKKDFMGVIVAVGVIGAIATAIYKLNKFLEKLGIQVQSSIEELLIVKIAEEGNEVINKQFKGSKNTNLYISLYFCRMYSTVCKLLLSGTYFSKLLNVYVKSGIVKGAVASSVIKKYFKETANDLDDKYNRIKAELTKPQEKDRQDRISMAEAAADIERLELITSMKKAKQIAEEYMTSLPDFLNQDIS